LGRRSRQVVQAELNTIRRLTGELKQDYEIAKELDLTISAVTKLKARMYQQDTEAWADASKESLESRALKIMQSLERCYAINKEIADDNTQDANDRIEASQIMVRAQINIFQLLKQGPTFRLQLPYKVTEVEDERIQYPRHTA
jgi:hypothetical protein